MTKTKKRRKATPAQKQAAKEKRAEIIGRSKGIQAARKAGISPYSDFATVNEGLIFDLKADTGFQDWRRFKQWKDEGFTVKKGEKASTIWGSPRKTKVDQTPEHEQGETEKSFSFFPLCYLFHAGQVQDESGNDGSKAKPYEHESYNPDECEPLAPKNPPPVPQIPAMEGMSVLGYAGEPLNPINKKIEKLRILANGMDKTIEEKLAPSNQNPTPKRTSQEASRRCDGEQMKQAQALLLRVASALETGETVPEWVQASSKKSALETVGKESEWNSSQLGYYTVRSVSFSDRLKDYTNAEHERDELADKISALRFSNIPGYFSTPETVAQMVIDRADIQERETVLEPSAGSGALADLSPVKPTCCEMNGSLREILELKGYSVPVDDFMCFGNAEVFDKIIMNPPFEKGQDVDHVSKAWEILAPGGRLVAIMSAAVNFNSQKKFAAFRELVDEHGYIEELPEGSFKQAGTGVNAVLVTLEKP